LTYKFNFKRFFKKERWKMNSFRKMVNLPYYLLYLFYLQDIYIKNINNL